MLGNSKGVAGAEGRGGRWGMQRSGAPRAQRLCSSRRRRAHGVEGMKATYMLHPARGIIAFSPHPLIAQLGLLDGNGT